MPPNTPPNTYTDGYTFPFFKDGNVKIVLMKRMSYRLHGEVLRQRSPVLKDLLDEASVSLAAFTKRITVPYHLYLVDNRSPDKRAYNGVVIEYVLEAASVGGDGRVANCTTALPYDGSKQIVLAYDVVLRALYGQSIDIGDPENDEFQDILSFALCITTVAEYLECSDIVTHAIESTLLATGQTLHRAISANPAAWLVFSERIHSKILYKEALIHAAGQMNQPTMKHVIAQGTLPPFVVNNLKEKLDAIKGMVQEVECKLTSYYPQNLMRTRPGPLESRESISRANYSNDILTWMALTVFRHFCGQQMAEDLTHHAPDLGYFFMLVINHGGDAYLSREELDNGYHLRFPMSAKAEQAVSHRLDEIKDAVKKFVTPLMKNNSQLDRATVEFTYFLFTDVEESDYPWLQEPLSDEINASDTEGGDDGVEYDEDAYRRVPVDWLMSDVDDDQEEYEEEKEDTGDAPAVEHQAKRIGGWTEEDNQAACDFLASNDDPTLVEGGRNTMLFSSGARPALTANRGGPAMPANDTYPVTSANDERSATPASDATEVMDSSVYDRHFESRRLERERQQHLEQMPLSEIRRGKRKAVESHPYW